MLSLFDFSSMQRCILTRNSRATCWWTRGARMEQSSMAAAYYRSARCLCVKNCNNIQINDKLFSKTPSVQPKTKSEPCALMHGDEVKMGETVLSFHIHSGTDTCDGCEPGQVIAHLSKHKREDDTGEKTHAWKQICIID